MLWSYMPRHAWATVALAVIIDGLLLFVPPSYFTSQGVPLVAFVVGMAILQFVFAAIVIAVVLHYRTPEEERDSEWKFHP